MSTAPSKRAPPRPLRTLVKLLVSLGVMFALAEALLHAFPALLPGWYRESFPMHGIELFRPGILERTPIEGLPLPILVEPLRGPPPADLKAMGLVPPDESSDSRRFPEVELPVDELGFPNARVLDSADLIIVGDSFAVAAASTRPPGLQLMLERESGARVYNLGVSAVGPVQEAWLLEHVGLPKRPRCVLWFFFSGNDVTTSLEPFLYAKDGLETYAEAYADRRAPRLLLPDVMRRWAARRRADPAPREPLPGLPFRLADGAVQPLWFNPFSLRQLAWSRETWEGNNGWGAIQPVLERAHNRCMQAGTKFVFVYLPSAEEVYLPFVEPLPELVHRMASFDLDTPLPEEPPALLAKYLERRHGLEECVRAFCEARGITFFSAVPHLEELARRGELAYLVADTHWQPAGQAAILAPLLELLEREGVVEH